jgi:DNA repair exonuclease SbcCD ATPase subunit
MELDDQKEKIEHNMLVEEEKKTTDKEIKEIRKEIQLNKKMRDNDYNRYLKNKDLINKKRMNMLMMENLEKELKEIKYEKQMKVKNDKIEIDISEVQEKLKKVNDTLSKQNIEQYKKRDFISKIEKDMNDYKTNIEKISDVENIKDRYEYYRDILEKDGLSICIIKKYLSIISNGINDIIKGIINKRVDLYEDSDKIILDIYNEKDEIVNFVGGMETFMIDLSFKIVLSRLLDVSRSNFLIIDEGISSFDKEHLGNIEDLFVFLKNYYDIIFIMSHIEGIKDYVDKQLIISSNSGYSRISSNNFR